MRITSAEKSMLPCTPPLNDVHQILTYLAECRPRVETSEGPDLAVERAGLWASRIAWLLLAVAFGIAYFLGRPGQLLARPHPVVLYMIIAGYGFFVIRVAALLWFLWARRHEWNRRAIDEVIERDERYAEPLLACSDLLLNYAKDWLKRQGERRDRATVLLMKDLGLIPAVGLVYAAFLAWQTIRPSLDHIYLSGSHTGALSPMFTALFWSALLSAIVGLFASRISVSGYAYRMEIIDVALKLKTLSSECIERAALQTPVDN